MAGHCLSGGDAPAAAEIWLLLHSSGFKEKLLAMTLHTAAVPACFRDICALLMDASGLYIQYRLELSACKMPYVHSDIIWIIYALQSACALCAEHMQMQSRTHKKLMHNTTHGR